MLGANVVGLANLASHVIIYDLIRLSIMCLQEESIAISALWKPHSGDLEVGLRSRSVRAKAANLNGQATSNRLSGSTILQANITSQFNVRS